MLVGEAMTAERAYQIGLANRIVANGSEVDDALELADEIVALTPLALATMKRFVNDHAFGEGAGRARRPIRGRARHGCATARMPPKASPPSRSGENRDTRAADAAGKWRDSKR